MKKIILSSIIFLMLTACVKNDRYVGYSFEGKELESIQVGSTTETQILEKLGSPTTRSDFGNKTYYYITFRQSRAAFLPYRNDEQMVLEIAFNDKDVVEQVKTYTLEHAKQIGYSEENTTLKGNEISPIQQILQNVGKFNAPKSKK